MEEVSLLHGSSSSSAHASSCHHMGDYLIVSGECTWRKQYHVFLLCAGWDSCNGIWHCSDCNSAFHESRHHANRPGKEAQEGVTFSLHVVQKEDALRPVIALLPIILCCCVHCGGVRTRETYRHDRIERLKGDFTKKDVHEMESCERNAAASTRGRQFFMISQKKLVNRGRY